MPLNLKPGNYYPLFSDLSESDIATSEVVFTKELLGSFIAISHDNAPVHSSIEYAQSMGFRDQVVHGFLVGMPYSRLLGMNLPGPNTVIQNINLDMIKPVYIQDRIQYRVEIKSLIESVHGVKLKLTAQNQFGDIVNRGSALCIFRGTPPSST